MLFWNLQKKNRGGILDKGVNFYMKKVLPFIGSRISGHKEAYYYLPNSIDEFLTTEMLAKEIEENGFKMEVLNSFSFGISTLFVARKK